MRPLIHHFVYYPRSLFAETGEWPVPAQIRKLIGHGGSGLESSINTPTHSRTGTPKSEYSCAMDDHEEVGRSLYPRVSVIQEEMTDRVSMSLYLLYVVSPPRYQNCSGVLDLET